MIKWGSMTSMCARIYAAHHLPTARALGLDSCGSVTPMFMKLTDALQQLSHQIIDDVPQPELKSQMVEWSVERATGASHGPSGRVSG